MASLNVVRCKTDELKDKVTEVQTNAVHHEFNGFIRLLKSKNNVYL